MHAFRFAVTACVLALITTQAAADDDVAAFYRGKTLSFTSAFAEGGLYSTVTRLVAEHLPRHLPGRPTPASPYRCPEPPGSGR